MQVIYKVIPFSQATPCTYENRYAADKDAKVVWKLTTSIINL